MSETDNVFHKGKGKIRRRTDREGPEGSRGIVRWWWVVTPRPGLFTLGKYPIPIVCEAGWAPRPVTTGAENLAPTRIRPPDLRATIPTELSRPTNVFHTVSKYVGV